VLRNYRSKVPLRRPARPATVSEEIPLTNRSAVEQALAAAERGEATDLPREGRQFTIRIVRSVVDTLQQSGLSLDETQRLYSRLATVLDSADTVRQLPQVPEMPDLRIYKTILGTPRTVHVFRLVL